MPNRAPIFLLSRALLSVYKEVERDGSEAELTGTRAGGESQRAGGGGASDDGDGNGGARGGAGDAVSADWQATGTAAGLSNSPERRKDKNIIRDSLNQKQKTNSCAAFLSTC